MIEFKGSKERDDYAQLGTKHPKLLDLLIDLAECVELMFKKSKMLCMPQVATKRPRAPTQPGKR